MTLVSTAKRLADYQTPTYLVSHVDITFELHPTQTLVTAVSQFRQASALNQPLVLNGQHLQLKSVKVNEVQWTHYTLTPETLILHDVPTEFSLEIVTEVAPQENLALEGLYLSNGAYCTQCEAEGFRRITFYPDRPDVMAIFTTHVIADSQQFPHLLSNGNLITETTLSDGRRKATWHDPFPKPCYLFALVAGDFDLLTGTFTTMSGRDVSLRFYVDKGLGQQAAFALEALKRAMKFDEDVYGLEYDLDIYMVVAVDFFNMGAMENKGLNIFNSKYVLADVHTATDTDFFNIESIIGHEYFHNWTGNRVTCRDWFQLSLKEGLTVFRDQQFSAAMGSPTLCRIDAIKTIRTAQFAEDSGPMAHPIRPESVVEMNNFYTVTVYDKGAEVIRMLHTLLGGEGFRKGMDLYFQRHDGQAVTCDDFVSALADANSSDFTQFKRWYSQAGTPRVSVKMIDNHTIELSQMTPETADGSSKEPFVIPVRVEQLAANGQAVDQDVWLLTEPTQQFVLKSNVEQTLPVLFGDFSAPVKVNFTYNIEQLIFIAKHSNDGVSRWDAMQTLWSQLVKEQLHSTHVELPGELVEVYRQWLQEPGDDLALTAELLCIPSYDVLAGQYDVIDIDSLLRIREQLHHQVADILHCEFAACYQALPVAQYEYNQQQVAVRQLKNVCLGYITAVDMSASLALLHYDSADNMTDRLAAMSCIARYQPQFALALFSRFYERFGKNPQLFDKLSVLTASIRSAEVFEMMSQQVSRAEFDWKNPNRVRAVYMAFSQQNPEMFHQVDGAGYRLLQLVISQLDCQNPQLAARLVTPLLSWRNYLGVRQQLMRECLVSLSQLKKLSTDLSEKVQRSL
jgi:aminopeptidase N